MGACSSKKSPAIDVVAQVQQQQQQHSGRNNSGRDAVRVHHTPPNTPYGEF